jgi:hypothetical protein
MYKVSGGCHCGNLFVEAQLTRAPESYNPRACDCDFCRKHGAAYVSDPQGSLSIVIRDEQRAARYRQGSGTAELLLCRDCGVVVGALYQGEEGLHGVVNAQAIEAGTGFGAPQPVSPRMLSAPEKVRRWQEIWFPNVSVRS